MSVPIPEYVAEGDNSVKNLVMIDKMMNREEFDYLFTSTISILSKDQLRYSTIVHSVIFKFSWDEYTRTLIN